ncbi:guanine nucleotide exchange factor MSS4 [Venturia canescens]|uniref:guanine nucleotide exchange factor MSS4 n=1 Tax=Venturia canescens TaxID=32260 RepID=UPI001C9C3DA3|nr:guanine nucleotide exchange factor MSS4 [Venturia canescens]
MSGGNDKCEAKRDSDGKNITTISCSHCPSKILNRGTATLINQEFSLPYVRRKEEGETDERESISEYWLVEDVYTFENILVSKTADNVKYLACADCERGPIGWHDIPTKKSYLALCRVRHA